MKFLGRVEVQLEDGGPWGPICGDGWGVPEAIVSTVLIFINDGILWQRHSYDKVVETKY